ncbi:hypothetical protein AB7M15_003339 [Bradyrhizobium ottawaense]
MGKPRVGAGVLPTREAKAGSKGKRDSFVICL